MGVRITTWNVNGIRNPFGYHPWREKRTFDSMFDTLEADIVIFQELKIQRKDLTDDMVLVPGWDVYFSLPKHKKGYSGVGIYTRQSVCAPIRAEEGLLGVLTPPNSSLAYRDMPMDEHIGGYLSPSQLTDVNIDPTFLDSEGRCVILEFPAFVLFGLYSPANSSGTRDDFRYAFLLALDMRVRNLIREGKRVIVCGDLNVSREEIDTANAEQSLRKEGLTHEDYISTPNRRIFNQLLEGGDVSGERDPGREQPVLWDVCRGFHPTRAGMFTHWEQKTNARPGNFGSRIDFILSSLSMSKWFAASDIQEGLMGSDHCPVYAILHDAVSLDERHVHLRDILNPIGVFQDGERQREYSTNDVPAFSAKSMPAFDKRRSIKDMFVRLPSIDSESPSALEHRSIQKHADTPGEYDTPDERSLVSSSKLQEDLNLVSQQPTQPLSSNKSNVASPRKRGAQEQNGVRSSKKRGTGLTAEKQTNSNKNQQSLTGFFKPRATANDASSNTSSVMEWPICTEPRPQQAVQASIYRLDKPSLAETAHDTSNGFSRDKDGLEFSGIADEPVIDPSTSKESWSKLLTKPPAPLCEHIEPCKLMKTKKSGVNCGRNFWMCQRPLGPSGDKERNSQWRCPTFIWNSDRKK